MTLSAVLPSPISKEVRALALAWLACLACMVIPAVADAPLFLGGISIPAYFVGVAAIGALSMGHEYTDRTLSLFLTLPARRARLFAIKLGVLAAMLLALWAVAYTLVFGDARMPQAEKDVAAAVPVLCALFLAPCLTMICRSPIGGAVFTLGIPGVLLLAGELIGVEYGYRGGVLDAFRGVFVWFGTLGLCAVGAVAGWWMFLRLEAIDSDQDVRLPHWLRPLTPSSTTSAESIKSHPIWLLAKKEVRLQQLPLALSALYVLCAHWLPTVWLTTPAATATFGSLLTALTFLHAGLVPMVIGSSASAGERQLGTLEWQVLLPIAAWKQWAVKVGVVAGLACVLAFGVPMTLVSLTRLAQAAEPVPFAIPPDPALVAFIMLLTGGTLYVSSLCRSGLVALVMSLPVAVGAWMFLNVVMDWVGIGWLLPSRVPTGLSPLLVTGFIAILLRFAFTNHCSADRPAARVWTQAIVMAAYVTAAVITMAAI